MLKLARILLISVCLISTAEAAKIPKYTGGSSHNAKFVKRHIRKHMRQQRIQSQRALSMRQYH